MDCKLSGQNALLIASLSNQPFGQSRAFPVRYHPADGIAAKDIQYDIKIKIGPFDRAQELGDVLHGGPRLGLANAAPEKFHDPADFGVGAGDKRWRDSNPRRYMLGFAITLLIVFSTS